MFIDGYERSNVVDDYKIFLKKKKELKSYWVEFDKSAAVKPKVYLLNCKVKSNNWQPIILISQDDQIFSTYNGI